MHLALLAVTCGIVSSGIDPYGGLTFPGRAVGVRIHKLSSANAIVWYPAEKAGGTPMTLWRYFELEREAGGVWNWSSEDPAVLLERGMTGGTGAMRAGDVSYLLDARLRSSLDAKADPDSRGQLFFWTVRHGTAVMQFALCEYLAARGHTLVAFSPREPVPYPWTLREPADKRTAADKSADLLVASIEEYRKHDGRPAHAIISWSYGMEAALAAACRTRVDKLYCLSSNPFSQRLPYRGEASLDLMPKGGFMSVLLHESLPETPRYIKADFPDSEALAIVLPGAKHGNFNALEGLLVGASGVGKTQPWAVGGSTAVSAYHAVCKVLARMEGPVNSHPLPRGIPKIDGKTVEIHPIKPRAS